MASTGLNLFGGRPGLPVNAAPFPPVAIKYAAGAVQSGRSGLPV